jgi:hypothetical protein
MTMKLKIRGQGPKGAAEPVKKSLTTIIRIISYKLKKELLSWLRIYTQNRYMMNNSCVHILNLHTRMKWRMGRAGHVVCMGEKRNEYSIWV